MKQADKLTKMLRDLNEEGAHRLKFLQEKYVVLVEEGDVIGIQ